MKRFESLDVLRGLAALAVVVFHIGVFDFQPAWIQCIAHYGDGGVQFFFVISGFVISLSSQKYFDRPSSKSFQTLLKKRLLRIYPAFLFSLIISSFLAHLFSIKAFSLSDFLLVSTLNYSLIGGVPPQVVYWSLNPEIQFYFMFAILSLPLVLKYKDYFIIVHLSLSLLVLSGLVSNHFVNATIIKHFYSFYLGMLAYDLTQGEFLKKNIVVKTIFGILSILLIAICMYSSNYKHIASIIAFLIVIGLVHFDSYVGKVNFGFFSFMGKVSYSLYLFHLPAFWILKRVFTDTDFQNWPGWFLLLGGAVVMSIAFFYLFENPFLNSDRIKKALRI